MPRTRKRKSWGEIKLEPAWRRKIGRWYQENKPVFPYGHYEIPGKIAFIGLMALLPPMVFLFVAFVVGCIVAPKEVLETVSLLLDWILNP